MSWILRVPITMVAVGVFLALVTAIALVIVAFTDDGE